MPIGLLTGIPKHTVEAAPGRFSPSALVHSSLDCASGRSSLRVATGRAIDSPWLWRPRPAGDQSLTLLHSRRDSSMASLRPSAVACSLAAEALTRAMFSAVAVIAFAASWIRSAASNGLATCGKPCSWSWARAAGCPVHSSDGMFLLAARSASLNPEISGIKTSIIARSNTPPSMACAASVPVIARFTSAARSTSMRSALWRSAGRSVRQRTL
jgi:hypothetical protein